MSIDHKNNWHAPFIDYAINSNISIPGSKSATNRAFVLAALGDEVSNIKNPLFARDTLLMLEALQKLGCEISRFDNSVNISPMKRVHQDISIDVGLAGTVMRFVPVLAALTSGISHFDGDLHARKRPMKALIDSLKKLQISIDDQGLATLPFSIASDGVVQGGSIEIDASESSQFISALMLVGARFVNGLSIKHVGKKLPSLPHIKMTIDMLKQVDVEVKEIGENYWKINPGIIKSKNWIIEPDLSNAGPFLASAMITHGEININDWPKNTTQAGNFWIEIFRAMGAEIELNDKFLKLKNSKEISGINIDLSQVGELTPVLASVALFANSPSQFSGIAHLRGHETNRIAALVENINNLGGDAQETADGLVINPKPLKAGLWKSFDDHRMATAGAVIGLKVKDVIVDDIATTSKTLPNFEKMWNELINK